MEYVNKKEVTEVLQKLIDARKNKNCSRQSIIERKAFEYALAIINKAKVYETDKDL